MINDDDDHDDDDHDVDHHDVDHHDDDDDDDDADNNDSNDGGGGVNPSCLLNCCSGTSNLPSKSTQSLRMTRQSQPKPGYKNNIRKGWVGSGRSCMRNCHNWRVRT